MVKFWSLPWCSTKGGWGKQMCSNILYIYTIKLFYLTVLHCGILTKLSHISIHKIKTSSQFVDIFDQFELKFGPVG